MKKEMLIIISIIIVVALILIIAVGYSFKGSKEEVITVDYFLGNAASSNTAPDSTFEVDKDWDYYVLYYNFIYDEEAYTIEALFFETSSDIISESVKGIPLNWQYGINYRDEVTFRLHDQEQGYIRLSGIAIRDKEEKRHEITFDKEYKVTFGGN